MKKWLVPCNVKNFNILEHFKSHTTAMFKKNRALAVGDEVYIYVAKPYSEILFKGVVVRSAVNPSEVDKMYRVPGANEKHFIEVQLVKSFPQHTFTAEALKQNGIGQVVNQQIIRGQAESYISATEAGLV